MDHRTLEVGHSAYFLHYRIHGIDYVLRLWLSNTIHENGNVRVQWVCQIRTDSGDYSNIVRAVPEFINNKRRR